MGMAVGGDEGVKHEPNVVPMIDIMLVLLIIFMIVTPIISAGFQAKMPQGKNIVGRAEESGDVVLGVDQNGAYYLDPGSGTINPVCPPRSTGACDQDRRLTELLTTVYTNRTRDKILYFKADQNLPYSQVENAIQIARQAGVRVLAAITEEQREGSGRMFGRRE
ncbi:MAG TPA: biopolymer transporter ExbD [Gemmatimonadales bacterium]|nr:biopolymer transporter ExbD [Gemmatimonadales bacterium]